jgi:kynurenine formamidase
MRIVDLSMTVEEWDSTPFAPEEAYFKLRPIVRWEDKGFVSNMVEMTVHAGTHIDSPHHFVREHPGVAGLPVEPMIPAKVKLIALPAKWRAESAPARVLALVDEGGRSPADRGNVR